MGLSNNNKAPKVIAFYLPQYHPTKNNDAWWGKGFTEWTNVAKAKKLYPGHYQPKIPADLGFYDLRLPQVRAQQAELAKEAGIYGFCYYHYWFSKGHEELDMPFKSVVQLGQPDFPFCLCWANESWYSKFWNKDGSSQKKLLAEQLYPGKEDDEAHFYSLLDAFKDSRYIKVHGKLLFIIYQPLSFPHFLEFKQLWNELAANHDLPGFFFIGQTVNPDTVDDIISVGFDAVNHCHRLDNYYQNSSACIKFFWRLYGGFKRIVKTPFVVSYKKAIRKAVNKIDYRNDVYPTMMPNWDHTPRSSDGGSVLHNARPEFFEKHAMQIMGVTLNKPIEDKIVFLKSWNEWGEGNYMEPDLRYGKGYIHALKRAINIINC